MRKWVTRVLIVVALLVTAGGLALWQGWITLPWMQSQSRLGNDPRAARMAAAVSNVPIQRADALIEDLQLTGKLTLRTVREVTAPFGEAIDALEVTVGDTVQVGDTLMTLDRDQLALDLDSAWLELMSAREALIELTTPSTELEKMEAQTNLLAAQEAVTQLNEGPAAADIEAAALAIQEAQVAMDELLDRNDPNSTEVRQARYDLQQAENAVNDAQTAYDAVSWRGSEAASEANALQSATISLESARLAYEEAIAPPDELDVQAAQLEIDQAQNSYTQLFEEATPAEIAQAQLSVAQAQDAILELEAGPTEQEIQEAEAAVLTALTTFEETRMTLQSGSAIVAPLDGLVTQISIVEGQVVERGDTVAVIAALDTFEINLSVSEEYILLLTEGMPVEISLDVAPALPITGVITYIAPVDTDSFSQGQTTSFESTSTSPGSYPVTIQVDATSGVETMRAGMNVQVTFVGSNQLPENSWLVPATSIRPSRPQSDSATIQVVRGETTQAIEVVVTDITQGEWQVVVSPELAEGDLVVGTTTTFLEESNGEQGGPSIVPGGGMPGGGIPGGGIPGGGNFPSGGAGGRQR